MEYKIFPLGYGDFDDNIKYIYIMVNLLLDNDYFDKDYLIIDKKDHGKRLMNFSNINGEITFTKGRDGDKYKLDLENKKIIKYGSDIEYKGPLFDEFPTYLLASIGFFDLGEENKKIIIGNNLKEFKEIINKLNLNKYENFTKDFFETIEIKNFLKKIFLTSSLYKRICEYVKLGKISNYILKDIINLSQENGSRKDQLLSFIDDEIKEDINLKIGISKNNFENSFAVLNGQTGKNANNRVAWVYEYISLLGLITFDDVGNIIFYNNGKNNFIEITNFSSDLLLEKLKNFLLKDIFYNNFNFGGKLDNYLQLSVIDNFNDKTLPLKNFHYEIIKRHNNLYLEFHNESGKDFLKNFKINDDYELFDWSKGKKSIRLRKTFELEEKYFSEINEKFKEMFNYLNQNIIKLINNNSNMEKLTSQEGLLLLSLLTKPFSILYGVSGTGKSRVVKELWKKLYGEDNYSNYFYKEAVPPNWFDETEILGRYNEIEKYKEGSFIKVLEKAIKDPKNNYVYLLDEMNLSHIEQYFAQYLSAIEDLNNGNALINVGEKSSYIIGSIDGINFEKYNKEKNYLIKYYLDLDNFEKLSFTNNKKIINSINKTNYSGNYNGKKLKGVSLKGEILSFSSNRKLYNFLIQYLIDNYFDNLETIQEYKNIISRNKEDLTYGDYAIEEYNGFFYANNFSTNDTIRHLFDLINKYAEGISNDDILLLTDEVELLEQEGYINNLNKINVVGKSLNLPKNLFVVGTINLDETTKSISPKVVDRANLIEFNDLDNFLFIEDNNKYDLNLFSNLDTNINFEEILKIREYVGNFNGDIKDFDTKYKIDAEIESSLNLIYQFLKIFKLHFSYRTLKEIIIFINIGKELLKSKGIKNLENKLYDIAVMQKILPKLNGIIDYNFKLYSKKDNKDIHLFYDINNIDSNSVLLDFKKIIESGFYNYEDNFKNSSMKLKRMQQFFDNYQNVNYFLS